MKYGSVLPIMILISLATIPAIAQSTPTSTPQNQGPLASFTYNPCVMCAAPGSVVFFNANYSWSPSGHITSYTWIFGDNSSPAKTNSPFITHDFLLVTPGKWNVTLTVQDASGATNSITQLVIFNIAPWFNYHPTHPMIQQIVTFNATATRAYTTSGTIKTFQWNYGDGTNATGIITKHAYWTSGTYRVTLTLVTSEGDAGISETITVYPRIIILNTTFDGLNVSLTGVFTVNATSQTASGSITVTAINATTGATVYTNTFDIARPVTNGNAQFILAIPTSSMSLGATCHVDSTGQTTSLLTRDPDIAHHAVVDITDVAQLAFYFGTTKASATYNPATDLNADGQTDILDVAIIASDFGIPVLA
jgi:PKD repeat protein